MNKELEALNRLKTFCLSENGMPYKMYSSSRPGIEEDAEIVEQALKRNEPMKVRIVSYTNGAFIRYECSNCNATIDDGDFCHNCGQRLEWGGYIK